MSWTEVAKPRIRTSVDIAPKLYELLKKHHIKISEAIRVGISILLAEKGVQDYDNKLTISRKLVKMSQLLDEKCEEIENLKINLQK